MTIPIAAWEAASMAHRKTSKRSKAKTMLRLADLEQSKNAVLHSLGAASSQESYGHAHIDRGGCEVFLFEEEPARRTTVLLNERRGSEQYHPINLLSLCVCVYLLRN